MMAFIVWGQRDKLLEYIDKLRDEIAQKEVVNWDLTAEIGSHNYPDLPSDKIQQAGLTGVIQWSLNINLVNKEQLAEYLIMTITREIELGS